MPIAKYLKSCSKNVPGIRPMIFLTEAANVATVTETANQITADITMAAGTTFKRVQADLDSVQFTSDGTFKTSGASTQELKCMFSKPSKALVDLVESIKEAVACGAVAIYVDNNAQGWLFGANGVAKEGITRPINEVQIEFDSGTLPTDEAQMFTVTLKRLSGYTVIPFDATINGKILDKTAAWIEWT